MTQIGRPQQDNPFSEIQKAPRRSRAQDSRNIGEQLNQIAGRVEESRFKSYEEHTQLDKDGFLKLLAHQLQNQDPMQPMDQKDFASDLAQFSQLEQLTNMNSNFEKMGANAGDKEKFHGASFLGTQVYVEGSSLRYQGNGSAMIPFYLDRPADRLLIRIYDDKGQLVSQMERESVSEGANNIEWNGVATDGTRARAGNYNLEVTGWDESQNYFHAQTQSSGLVTGVQFENGETVLIVDGERRLFLRDVQRFDLPQLNTSVSDDLDSVKNEIEEDTQEEYSSAEKESALNPKVKAGYDQYMKSQDGFRNL